MTAVQGLDLPGPCLGLPATGLHVRDRRSAGIHLSHEEQIHEERRLWGEVHPLLRWERGEAGSLSLRRLTEAPRVLDDEQLLWQRRACHRAHWGPISLCRWKIPRVPFEGYS